MIYIFLFNIEMMIYWITLGQLGLTIKFLTRVMDMTKMQ